MDDLPDFLEAASQAGAKTVHVLRNDIVRMSMGVEEGSRFKADKTIKKLSSLARALRSL